MTINGNISIATALNCAVANLSLNKSIETPRLDAEVLLCEVLNCERIFLVINKDQVLTQSEYAQFSSFISRRAKNEPVSYITGKREFMSLEFNVQKGILVPRPDTEILVEKIIDTYKESSVKILDLCTGSGAIAVSLAYYLKDSSVIAVDKYDICVQAATQNAKKHNVSDRVCVIKADVLDTFSINEQIDCIVSNPPYIKSEVLTSLPSDIKDYEPDYALDGGNDGLIFYEKITEYASKKLNPCGILAFEIGFDQGESVKQIIDKTGDFINIEILKDLAGLDRVITAEKR